MNLSQSPLDQLASRARTILISHRPKKDAGPPDGRTPSVHLEADGPPLPSLHSSPASSPRQGVFNFSRPRSQQAHARRASATSLQSTTSHAPPTDASTPPSLHQKSNSYAGIEASGPSRSRESPSPSRTPHAPKTKRKGSHLRVPSTPPISPEDHVALGIKLHQQDELALSAYHFRLAAQGLHPTGMLMYALALRHGWGCSKSPQQAISWLQQAASAASGDLAILEGNEKAVFEKKDARAQLALAMYELGASYANGWGVKENKKLALKSFEAAATWGDVDAMQEAGLYYAQGIGCKKDLHRAATFYRTAVTHGAPLTGLSWIYKPKFGGALQEKGKNGVNI